MIPITQDRVGEDGNCLSACLASILEVPLQTVPDFAAETETDEEFLSAVDAWLAKKGLRYRQVALGDAAPVGWHTVEGLSPRGGQHACVAKNGALMWDPHPRDGTGRGLVRAERWGVLEPLRRRTEDTKVRRIPKPRRETLKSAGRVKLLRLSPGDPIRLPNGRRTTVEKVTPARNLFGEEELHVKTTTGEVLPVPVRKERA